MSYWVHVCGLNEKCNETLLRFAPCVAASTLRKWLRRGYGDNWSCPLARIQIQPLQGCLGGACWLDRTGAVVMIDDPQQLPQALAANHLHQALRYAEHYLYGDGPCSIASLASL